MSQHQNEALSKANKKLALKMLWIVIAASIFGVLLVPLYNVLCEVTGLNGKTANQSVLQGSDVQGVAQVPKVDEKRKVTVQFVTSVMTGLGWNFHPMQDSIVVHPGQIQTVVFEAKNTTSQTLMGQAIPSISPGKATMYMKKIECFCFTNQSLKAGETKQFPLRFYISPEIPQDIHELTLSYSFYKAVSK